MRRRTALKPSRGTRDIPIDVRAAVLVRDRACVLSFLERNHVCRDQWGNEHRPDDLAKLTMEHVRLELGGTRRSVPEQLVALDWATNIHPPTKVQRALMREYLRSVALRVAVAETLALDCVHVDPVFGCRACEARRVSA